MGFEQISVRARAGDGWKQDVVPAAARSAHSSRSHEFDASCVDRGCCQRARGCDATALFRPFVYPPAESSTKKMTYALKSAPVVPVYLDTAVIDTDRRYMEVS